MRGLFGIAVAMTLAASLAAAQPAVVDTRAERMVHRVIDGEPVTHLYGDVLIVRDSLTVAADSALFYEDTEEYDFFGHVRATRGEAVLTCAAAFYNDRTRDADFEGDVRLVDADRIATSRRAEMRREGDMFLLIRDARVVSPDYVVHADSIASYEESDTGEAWGNVILVEPGAASVVKGGHATFDRGGGRMTVDREPLLESRDQGADPLLAEARVMDFLRDLDRVVMVDSVRIRQGKSVAVADTARIFGRERMRLTGGPPVMDDGEGGTFSASAVEYWYEDGKMKRVRLEGDASVVDTEPAELAAQYRGLPDTDTLTGDTITVDMDDGEPVRSLVVGGARSVYVPAEAAKEVAYNDVSGDTIVLGFKDRRIRQVDVRGTMKGTYSFVRLDEVEEAAEEAVAALDSLLAARPDSLMAAMIPDSLSLDPELVRSGLAEMDPAMGLVLLGALAEGGFAAGDSAVAEAAGRILALGAADTTGGDGLDFSSLRETVEYSGDMGIFQLGKRQIAIRGDGQLVYGTLDLKAGDIRMDTESRELYAEEQPLLVDGAQKIAGVDMAYDFGNRTGAVRDGATTMDEYFYVGRHIKRFGDGDLKIRGGRMTSCNLSKPHYHFWADRMKIQLDDKVVAAPIVMKIGEVPLVALPFYFKNLETGRRSGIHFPTFDSGWGSRTGRYIRNWGYYWATNDYTDFSFLGDYNERRQLTWQINNRYVLRDAFNGSVRYSRRTTLGNGPQTKEWQLQWRHDQPQLLDDYRFSADLKMSSSTVEREDLLGDYTQVVNPRRISNVSIGRNWENLSGSLAFKREEIVNAGDENILTNNLVSTQHFPQLSVSFKSRALMPPLRGGRKGSFLGNVLRNTYLSHNYRASSTRTEKETTSLRKDNASGNLSLSIKPPRLWIFNVSTGVSAGFNWQRDEGSGDFFQVVEGDTVLSDATQFVEESAKSLGMNSSASTTLYGLFYPRIGSLRGMRHTMKFSMSHSWRPEIGGTQTADQRFGFTLGNRIDLKFADDGEASADSTESFRKLDGVVDWNLSTSYDPDLDRDDRWSTIQSTFRFKPGSSRNAQITVNSSIDPYEMRVTSTRFNYNLGVSGRIDTGGEIVVPEPETNEAIAALAELDSLDQETDPDADPFGDGEWEDEDEEWLDDGFEDSERDLYDPALQFTQDSDEGGRDETEGGRYIPWRASGGLRFSRNHLTDDTTARLTLSASATLTRTWKATWRSGYDLNTGLVSQQSWSLEKDLHCWSLRFQRTVSSVDSQFGFVVRLKAIPDIKVTKGREDLVGGGMGSTGGGFF